MSSFPPTWLRYVAAACACFLAAGVFWPFPVFRDALVICGLLATGGAVAHGVRKRRDPYDLQTLKDLDEREELRNLDVPDVEGIDQVHCMCCMRVYDIKYPTCPHCAEGQRRKR